MYRSKMRGAWFTFGWRHVEGHSLGPGAVPCQGSGTHTSRVIPRAEVSEASSSVPTEVLLGHTLVLLGL